jgi:hypothetical protein
VQDSQIGRAESTSPSDTALRLSGKVQDTSYIGKARASPIIATLRKVQRRNGSPGG